MLLLPLQKVYTKRECISKLLTVLRNIGTNAFFSHLKLCFFFKRICLFFFIVRPAINKKKKNILLTQRADGIRVEKSGHAKSYQTVEGGLFTDAE